MILERPGRLEHAVQLSGGIEGVDPAVLGGTVVAPPDELSLDPNGRHGRPTEHVAHLGADRLAVGLLVEFHHRVLGTLGVEQFFRLDAEGSRDEREHEDGTRFHERIHLGPDRRGVVLAREGLHEANLPALEEGEEVIDGARREGGDGRSPSGGGDGEGSRPCRWREGAGGGCQGGEGQYREGPHGDSVREEFS